MSDLELKLPLVTLYMDPAGGVASVHAPELPQDGKLMVVVRSVHEPDRILDIRPADPELLEVIAAVQCYGRYVKGGM